MEKKKINPAMILKKQVVDPLSGEPSIKTRYNPKDIDTSGTAIRIRPETPKLNLLNIKPQKPEKKKYYQWPSSGQDST